MRNLMKRLYVLVLLFISLCAMEFDGGKRARTGDDLAKFIESSPKRKKQFELLSPEKQKEIKACVRSPHRLPRVLSVIKGPCRRLRLGQRLKFLVAVSEDAKSKITDGEKKEEFLEGARDLTLSSLSPTHFGPSAPDPLLIGSPERHMELSRLTQYQREEALKWEREISSSSPHCDKDLRHPINLFHIQNGSNRGGGHLAEKDLEGRFSESRFIPVSNPDSGVIMGWRKGHKRPGSIFPKGFDIKDCFKFILSLREGEIGHLGEKSLGDKRRILGKYGSIYAEVMDEQRPLTDEGITRSCYPIFSYVEWESDKDICLAQLQPLLDSTLPSLELIRSSDEILRLAKQEYAAGRERYNVGDGVIVDLAPLLKTDLFWGLSQIGVVEKGLYVKIPKNQLEK